MVTRMVLTKTRSIKCNYYSSDNIISTSIIEKNKYNFEFNGQKRRMKRALSPHILGITYGVASTALTGLAVYVYNTGLAWLARHLP